jgi:hypothetical protein
MSSAGSKTDTSTKTPASEPKKPELKYGFPGTEEERAERIRRVAEEHKETLRRLGK